MPVVATGNLIRWVNIQAAPTHLLVLISNVLSALVQEGQLQSNWVMSPEVV